MNASVSSSLSLFSSSFISLSTNSSSSSVPTSSFSGGLSAPQTNLSSSATSTGLKISSKTSVAQVAVASSTASNDVGSSSTPSATSQVSPTSQSASPSSLPMSSSSEPAKTDAASAATSTSTSQASSSSTPSPSSSPTNSSHSSSSSPPTSPTHASENAASTSSPTSDASKATSTSASVSSGTQEAANQATSGSTDSAENPSPTSEQSGTSTSVIVVVNSSSRSTFTSTITDKPDSTFSTPEGGVTVTNSVNGHTSISFPAVVTVLSTSEAPDGSLLTITHTVANPTGVVSGENLSHHSFLQNEGAVAGVFTVVGVVVTALAICLFMICRRRYRRHNQRRRWIVDMQRRLPEPDNPFEDPRHAPTVRTVNVSNHSHYDMTPPGTAHVLFDDNVNPMTASPSPGNTFERSDDRTLFGNSNTYRTNNTEVEQEIGLAVTTNGPLHLSRPSLVQSSPSIYPSSLPSQRDDAGSVYEDLDLHHPVLAPQQVRQQGDFSNASMANPASTSTSFTAIGTGYGLKRELTVTGGSTAPAPPMRPPRSVLRQPSKTTSMSIEYNPLTPPPSISSHGHTPSNPPTPITGMPAAAAIELERQGPFFDVGDYTGVGSGYSYATLYKPPSPSKGVEDILTRRTLLDIRPRSRDDSTEK